MPNRTCHRCGRSVMVPLQNNPDQEKYMCRSCLEYIEQRINQIDRNAKEDVKEGKLKVMFRDIPSETVPIEIQQMVEEVGDPEFLPEARIHKAGRIDQLTNDTSKGLELKPRFAP